MNPLKTSGLALDEIVGEYCFDSAWHVQKSLAWLDYAKRSALPQCLRYAAIELRTGVEMLWFEILVMSLGGEISEAEYARCCKESTTMYKLIDKLSPDYRKMMLFLQTMMSLEKNAPKIAVWDITRLKQAHGKASAYLHFQGIPQHTIEAPSWLGEGISELEELANYIWTMLISGGRTGNMSPENMEPETHAIWEQFRSGAIDEAGAKTQLLIAKPILGARRRNFG